MVRQPYTIHFASKSFGGCPLVTYQSNTSVLVCQIWIPPEKVCDSRCLFRWFYLRYLIIIIFRLEMLALPIKLLLTPTCWSDCRSNSCPCWKRKHILYVVTWQRSVLAVVLYRLTWIRQHQYSSHSNNDLWCIDV